MRNENSENKVLTWLKEHKTPVAIVIAVILFLSLGVVLWNANSDGKDVDNNNGVISTEVNTEVDGSKTTEDVVSTETDTEENYLDDITTAPDSTETEGTEVKDSEVIEFPSDETETTESTESSESTESTESTEVDNSESIEKVPETEKPNDGSNGNSDKNDGDNGDVVVDNTPDSSESTSTPEDNTPSTPSTSGGHISWNGPGTYLSNIGVSIPTLGAFNKEALNANTDGWAGDDSTTEGHNAGQTVLDTARAIESTVKNKGVTCDTGMVVQNNAIEWTYTTYGSMNSFELHREPSNNRYRLEVNIRLCDGTVLDGTDIGPINRDILLYLCSVVSSTPDTLYANIYQDIEGEVCISDSSWTTVGDCKVKFDLNNSYNNHYVYYIKQN